MIITKEWLIEKKACDDGIKWFCNQAKTESFDVLNALVADKKLKWANWLIVRVMEYKQYVSYAVFAADQVIGIYEKKYPDDSRPRNAIEAAKKCIENPSAGNKKTAAYAAYAAYAADAAAAADAAYAAYAAYAADAYAADAYAYAAYAAYAAAAAADAAMRLKILNYGMGLLTK